MSDDFEGNVQAAVEGTYSPKHFFVPVSSVWSADGICYGDNRVSFNQGGNTISTGSPNCFPDPYTEYVEVSLGPADRHYPYH